MFRDQIQVIQSNQSPIVHKDSWVLLEFLKILLFWNHLKIKIEFKFTKRQKTLSWEFLVMMNIFCDIWLAQWLLFILSELDFILYLSRQRLLLLKPIQNFMEIEREQLTPNSPHLLMYINCQKLHCMYCFQSNNSIPAVRLGYPKSKRFPLKFQPFQRMHYPIAELL